MNIEINYNYKFYLWGIAKPHRLWSMKLHVSSPTSEPPTIVRSNKHGDVMGLSWGYDDSGCGIYIYISILLELGQYGSIGGWFTTNKHYTKSLLTTYHGGFILAGGHPHDSGTLLLITPDPSKKTRTVNPSKWPTSSSEFIFESHWKNTWCLQCGGPKIGFCCFIAFQYRWDLQWTNIDVLFCISFL